MEGQIWLCINNTDVPRCKRQDERQIYLFHALLPINSKCIWGIRNQSHEDEKHPAGNFSFSRYSEVSLGNSDFRQDIGNSNSATFTARNLLQLWPLCNLSHHWDFSNTVAACDSDLALYCWFACKSYLSLSV